MNWLNVEMLTAFWFLDVDIGMFFLLFDSHIGADEHASLVDTVLSYLEIPSIVRALTILASHNS